MMMERSVQLNAKPGSLHSQNMLQLTLFEKDQSTGVTLGSISSSYQSSSSQIVSTILIVGKLCDERKLDQLV